MCLVSWNHFKICTDIGMRVCVCVCFLVINYRDDYNSLTSQVILLNVRPLVHYLSNVMYGCPIKLRDNMAINGFF